MVLSEDVCASILDRFTKGADGEEISISFSQAVKALMPENVFSNHLVGMQMTVSQGHQSQVLNFLNLAMFLVSNNFFGATADVSGKVYRWVKRLSNAGLLEYLLSISGPTAEALAENLFRLAINDNDVLTVKKIMESGIDPNGQIYRTRRGLGLTPVHRACAMRSLELVRVLIEAGADVNSTVSKGDSALMCALYRFDDDFKPKEDLVDTELVRILLRAGAKVNPGYGKSPLSEAAQSGHVEAVALLISAGADVNFSDEAPSLTPLVEAVFSDKRVPDEDVIAIVRNLLHGGADVQATAMIGAGSVTVLEAAMHRGNIELIQLLLGGGARITESAFLAAVRGCSLDIAKLLIRSGARVTRRVIESADESEMVLFLLDSAEHSIKERYSSAALVAAIHHGKTDLIDALDASGVQLNSTLKLDDAIGAATRRGDIRLLLLLLSDNSRYRASITKSLGSSLHIAIANGRNDIVEMLLAAGAEVNTVSPLLAAIRRKDAHIARKLLAAGAAVNAIATIDTDYGRQYTTTVLPAAVAWGYHPLIRDIISAGAEVSAPECEESQTALSVAVERRDVVAIQLLIDAGADVNASAATLFGRTALEAAVRNNDIDMAHYLLSIGADPDDGSLIAAVSGSAQLMQILLTARLSRYQRCSKGYGCGALQRAIQLKNAAMVEILLANGVDANAIVHQKLGDELTPSRGNASTICYGESALGTAIKTDKSNELWIVQMLLRNGADPNSIVIESTNSTALLAAINQKNLALVNALIAAGADVSASLTARISRTPLQLAAKEGSIDIAHVLLKHGADVNAPPYNRYGATALQFAAIGGYVGIAYLLLERGAEVNASPAKIGGRTALEGAAEHGRIDVLQLLLNAGAQVIGPGGEQYERAREFASKNGHIAARRLLESYKGQWLGDFVDWDLTSTDVGFLDGLQF
jgi:ankyrin repeat protein